MAISSKRMNLTDQLAFYGAYHNNKWNQLIHIIFVPLIWWSSVVLTCYSGPLFNWSLNKTLEPIGLVAPAIINDNLVPHLGLFVAAFYVVYYMYLGDYLVALPYNCFLVALFLSANHTYTAYGSEQAWKIALVSQAIGWYVQVDIGHKRIEGRKPALLDSLFDAIVMAPIFTFYEIVFALGYRKQLKQAVDARVAMNILELDAKKAY